MSSAVPPQGSSIRPSPLVLVELADLYEQRDEPKMRDRFLILAADAAFAAGQLQDADRFLRRLLQVSPHHMFKVYPTFAEAVRADPVRVYIADLRRNYPPDVVQNLLESLRGRTVPVETKNAAVSLGGSPLPPEPPREADNDWTALLTGTPAKAGRSPEPSRPAAPSQPKAKPAPAVMPTPLGPAPPAAKLAVPAKPPAAPTARPVPTAARVKPTAPARSSRKRKNEPKKTSGLVMFLMIVIVLGGLALLAYTLGRPFLR